MCGAVQDLIHVSTAPLVETYLRRVLGRQPTEEEVEALLLEARLAEHIHFYIHRPIFFDRQPAESFLQHARGLAAVFVAALPHGMGLHPPSMYCFHSTQTRPSKHVRRTTSLSISQC